MRARAHVVPVLVAAATAIAFAAGSSANALTASPTGNLVSSDGTNASVSVGTGQLPASAPAPAVAADGEIPSMRTADSRTYRDTKAPSGYETHLYAGPVNYKDANGAWQKIDPALVAGSGGQLTSTGSPVAVTLPSSLASGSVTLTGPGGQVGFSLVGAKPSLPVAAGGLASYAGVLSGTDLRYEPTIDGIKETMVLSSATSTSTATFAFAIPAGDRLVASGGGASVLSAAGTVVARVQAPFVTDAAGVESTKAVTETVGGTASAPTLTVAVDPTWLAASDRSFPVTVDPTVAYPTTDYATWLEGGTDANTNYSTSSLLCAGRDTTSSNQPARILIKASDLGTVIPRDAEITNSSIVLTAQSIISGGNTFAAYPVSRAWNPNAATWNIADTGTNWTTAGGDIVTSSENDPFSITTAGTLNNWSLDPRIMQSWIDNKATFGTGAQNGFEIKATNEAAGGAACFYSLNSPPSGDAPYISLGWMPRYGLSSTMKYFDHSVDDRESIHVNLANGNLVDTSTDVSVQAPGIPMSFSRTYNSQAGGQDFSAGRGWTTDPGDTAIYADGFDDTPYWQIGSQGTSNWWSQSSYASMSTTTYVDAPGTNASLSAITWPTSAKITAHGSQEVQTYNNTATGSLSKLTDRSGNNETFSYSATQRLNGNNSYSPFSLTGITDTAGRTYTVSTSTGTVHYITGVTSPVGSVSYSQDPATGYLTSATNLAGKTTYYGYDSSQRLISITTPTGRKVLFAYNAANQVSGLEYVTNYNTGCVVTNFSTCTGNLYTFAYSAPTSTGGTGNTVVTDPNTHATTYYWNSDDQVTKVTDALSRNESSTFNPNYNPLTLEDNLSNVQTSTYDTLNNLTKIQDPSFGGGTSNGGTIQYGYPSAVSNGTGGYTPASYEATSSTDEQNKVTTYGYTSSGPNTGMLSTVTPPTGIGGSALTNHYQGDSGITCGGKNGELCSTVDGLGHTTSYAYDTSGNLTSVTPPSPLGATTITPDSDGRPVTIVDGVGSTHTTRYTYDNEDRVTQVEVNNTTTCTSANLAAGTCFQYAYDDDGNLTSRTGPGGTSGTVTTYTYDYQGGPLTKTLPGTTTSSVTYDNAENIASYTDAGGTVTYGYDAANELTQLAEPGGSCVTPISRCTTFTYDGAGNPKTTTYPSGEKITTSYDTASRPTSIVAQRPSGTNFFARTLTYTVTVGSTTTDTGLLQGTADTPGSTTAFTYDALSRLTQAAVASGTTYGYAYDAAGNRTSSTVGAATTYYGYNNADELCWSGATSGSNGTTACPTTPTGDTAYTYDGAGNQLTGVQTGTYNSMNQTTAVTLGATSTSLGYGDTGQSERTSVTSGGTTTTEANGLLGITGQTVGSTGYYFTRTPSGQLISLRNGAGGTSTNSYYLTDQQGSVLRLTDSTGNTDTASYTYDPYGTALTATGTQATVNPYRYAGGYYDSTTGLLKLGDRYEQTALGRFTQSDAVTAPISAPTAVGKYGYAGDAPTMYVDPSGNSFLSIGISINFGFGHLSLGADIGEGGFHPFVGGGLGPKADSPVSFLGSAHEGAAKSGSSLSVNACSQHICASHSLTGGGSDEDISADGGTSASIDGTYTF